MSVIIFFHGLSQLNCLPILFFNFFLRFENQIIKSGVYLSYLVSVSGHNIKERIGEFREISMDPDDGLTNYWVCEVVEVPLIIIF
jgi:hypothetical protein